MCERQAVGPATLEKLHFKETFVSWDQNSGKYLCMRCAACLTYKLHSSYRYRIDYGQPLQKLSIDPTCKHCFVCDRACIFVMVQVFLLIEIIWPVLLFVILAGLRFKFPPEDIPQCKCVCVCVVSQSLTQKRSIQNNTVRAGIYVNRKFLPPSSCPAQGPQQES